jgi:FMN phosphatase YigB (HAD superfamily)
MRTVIIFDVGETLIDFQKNGLWYESLKQEVLPRMYTEIRSSFSPNASNPFDQVSLSEFCNVGFEIIAKQNPAEKILSMEKRLRELLLFFHFPISESILFQLFSVFYSTIESDIVIYPEIIDCLQKLQAAQYHIGLYSDTPWQAPGFLIDQILAKLTLLPYFEFKIYSGDWEIRKPEPDAMEIILKITKFKKSDCIYIGNSDRDIDFAFNVGIPAIWVQRDSNEKLNTLNKPTYTISSLNQLFEILPHIN